MTATIVKRLMTAVPGKDMFLFPVGDVVADNAATSRGADLPFDADAVGAYLRIMDEMVAWIAEHRVFDVRGVWDVVMGSVPTDALHPKVGWSETNGGTVTTAAPVDLPLASPPRIGIEGVYVIEDTVAVYVRQNPDNPDDHSISVMHLDPDGDIMCDWGTGLHADGDAWNWALSYGTITPQATRFRESMPVAKWRETVWETEWTGEYGDRQGLAEVALWSFRTAAAVLLVNALVLADPTIMRTEVTPKPLVKANAKRGRRTPRARSWIDLTDVRYNKRSGSWTGHRAGTGVSWHQVRGHWRQLSSDRFTNLKGQKVWVRPHTKGSAEAGRSTTPYRVKREGGAA